MACSVKKVKVLKIPPELADGNSWIVLKRDELSDGCMLLESLRGFLEWGAPGDNITMEITEMSEEEIDALPDI